MRRFGFLAVILRARGRQCVFRARPRSGKASAGCVSPQPLFTPVDHVDFADSHRPVAGANSRDLCEAGDEGRSAFRGRPARGLGSSNDRARTAGSFYGPDAADDRLRRRTGAPGRHSRAR